jgi:hypothetical protein
MTVVRTPVLLPGFYWFDDIAKAGAPTNFTTWRNSQKGLVIIRNTNAHFDETPPRQWILFEVKFPALWDQRLGFPETADKGAATTEEDTRSAPPLSTDANPFGSLDLSSLFSGGAGVLVLGALLLDALSSDGR